MRELLSKLLAFLIYYKLPIKRIGMPSFHRYQNIHIHCTALLGLIQFNTKEYIATIFTKILTGKCTLFVSLVSPGCSIHVSVDGQ